MDWLRTVAAYASGGTLGTLCLVYGIREFLRATDGYYRGLDRLLAQGEGVVVTFLGWAILLVVVVTFHRRLRSTAPRD